MSRGHTHQQGRENAGRIQRTAAATEVAPILNSAGRLLDSETRHFMESRIGFDFSNVRIHNDGCAAASATSLGARAYTFGSHVVFGPGSFAPHTTEGRRLLAHELTHTAQQARSLPRAGQMTTGKPHDAFELEADEFSRRVDSPDVCVPAKAPPRQRTTGQVLQKYEAYEHAQFAQTGDIIAKAVSDRAFLYKVLPGEMPKAIAVKLGIAEEDLVAANASKMTQWKLKKDPKKSIEGFNAGEEIVIPPVLTEATREAVKNKTLSFVVSGVTMTYEEGITMGDFYPSADKMLTAPAAELTALQAKIKKERAAGKALDAQEWDDVTGAQGDKYTDQALKNDTHFAPSNAALATPSGKSPGNHRTEWEGNHGKALKESQDGEKDKALATNSFADHFLTDAFASGHLFNRRDAVETFEGKLPKTAKGDKFTDDSKKVFDEVSKKAFVGPVKDEFSKYETVEFKGGFFRPNINSESRFSALLQGIHLLKPLNLEGAVVKGVHDKLNAEGVEVENAKGDKWVLKGDGSLATSDPKTLEVGKKAVAQSQLNVLDEFKKTRALDLPALFSKVWDYVPHPTAGAGEAKVRDTVATGTDPKSSSLIDAIVNLIRSNYQLIIAKLVEMKILKRA